MTQKQLNTKPLTDFFTAVILAGGKNSRFDGKDKAFLNIGGIPMIELISGRLREIFGKLLVVTNTPEKYRDYTDLPTVRDTFTETGPLGGIHAAMLHAQTPWIFVVSCDMPYINRAIIEKQVLWLDRNPGADALVPRIKSHIEPMHAIYASGQAGALGDFLESASDYSIRAFLRLLNVVYMDLPPDATTTKAFSNINSPRDLGRIT